MSPLLLGMVLSLGTACAGHRQAIPPEPAWELAGGKERARVDMADALAKGGSPEAALAMVSQIRGEGVKDSRLDLIQARALRGIGLTDDAESLLRDVLKKHPRQAGAWDQLGILCMDTKRLEEAQTLLARAHQLSPTDALILNNLGFAQLTGGHPEDAVQTLHAALRLDGADRQIRNNLGFALVAAGQDDEALRVFRAGLPEADARYNLALGLELRGDDQAAIDQYAKVLARFPSHQPSIDGLRRLRPGELHRLAPPTLDSDQEAP